MVASRVAPRSVGAHLVTPAAWETERRQIVTDTLACIKGRSG